MGNVARLVWGFPDWNQGLQGRLEVRTLTFGGPRGAMSLANLSYRTSFSLLSDDNSNIQTKVKGNATCAETS